MFAPARGSGQDRRMVFDARTSSGSRSRRDATRPAAGRRPRSAAPSSEPEQDLEPDPVDESGPVRDEPVAEPEEGPVTLRLDGKVALVTGAGSPDGIGYAT